MTWRQERHGVFRPDGQLPGFRFFEVAIFLSWVKSPVREENLVFILLVLASQFSFFSSELQLSEL